MKRNLEGALVFASLLLTSGGCSSDGTSGHGPGSAQEPLSNEGMDDCESYPDGCDGPNFHVDAGAANVACTKQRQFVDRCTTVRDIIQLANEVCAGGRINTLQYFETPDCSFGANSAVVSCCFSLDGKPL